MNKRNHFPLFIYCKGMRAIVIGGGKIAERRIKTLLKFNFDITVISKSLTEGLVRLKDAGEFNYMPERYRGGDLKDFDMVVACTNDREVNKIAGIKAREASIPVSVCDSAEESTFWFPSVLVNEDLIMGLVGDGVNHRKLKITADRLREVIRNEDNCGVKGE